MKFVKFEPRTHMEEVLHVNKKSYPDCEMGRKDLYQWSKTRSHYTACAIEQGIVVGFMMYEVRKREIEIERLAVLPAFRRQKVGSQLMALAFGGIRSGKREYLTYVADETNLAAHLFLRHCGLDCLGQDGPDMFFSFRVHPEICMQRHIMEIGRTSKEDAST